MLAVMSLCLKAKIPEDLSLLLDQLVIFSENIGNNDEN